MYKKNNKVLGAITLLSTFVAAQAFADIQILGSESEVSQLISDHYLQSSQFYNGNLASNDVLYINVGSASDDDMAAAKSHISQGDRVIVDLRQIPGEDSKIQLSQSLTGLGSDSPIVVTGMYQGDKIINSIVVDVRDENDQPINNASAGFESLKHSLIHALDRLGFGGK